MSTNMGTKINTPLKFHCPEQYKNRFIDFCDLNKLRHGRVLWTLVKMFIKGEVSQGLFLAEYRKSTEDASKSHGDILRTYRVTGSEAHKINKLTKTAVSDTTKEDFNITETESDSVA